MTDTLESIKERPSATQGLIWNDMFDALILAQKMQHNVYLAVFEDIGPGTKVLTIASCSKRDMMALSDAIKKEIANG